MYGYVSVMIGLSMYYHSAMAKIGKACKIVSYCIVMNYKSLDCCCCCCCYDSFYFSFILFYLFYFFFFKIFYKYIQYKELD